VVIIKTLRLTLFEVSFDRMQRSLVEFSARRISPGSIVTRVQSKTTLRLVLESLLLITMASSILRTV
jgi:hypothetical protein